MAIRPDRSIDLNTNLIVKKTEVPNKPNTAPKPRLNPKYTGGTPRHCKYDVINAPLSNTVIHSNVYDKLAENIGCFQYIVKKFAQQPFSFDVLDLFELSPENTTMIIHLRWTAMHVAYFSSSSWMARPDSRICTDALPYVHA